MTRDTYRAHPALNFSLAKHFLTSPAHFQAARTTEKEETIDMRLGTHVHGYWLEGVEPKFITRPDCYPDGSVDQDGNAKKWNGNAKVCKAWTKAQTLPILTAEEAERQTRMCRALKKSAQAVHCLKLCEQREVPILFEYDGVPMKALLDAFGFPGGQPTILDLKKVQDASPAAFAKQVAKYHYDLQMHWYCVAASMAHGLEEPPDAVWQVVEDSPAAVVAHYDFGPEWRANGERKFLKVVRLYKECVAAGKWPAYGDKLLRLPLPKWAEFHDEPESEP
jgi:hypothetical protein